MWPTHQARGKSDPNLYRQTTRHEVAVAAVSARYLARGYAWTRDREVPRGSAEHQVDGVAVKGDLRELVEVELTAKTLARYRGIFANHLHRMKEEDVSRVVYFGTPEASRAVSRERDRIVHGDWHPRLMTLPVFDVRGNWVTGDFGLWGTHKEKENVDAGGGVESEHEHGSIHEGSTEGSSQS